MRILQIMMMTPMLMTMFLLISPSAKQNCDILEMENVEVKIVDKDSVDFCISGKRKREDTPKMQEINEQKVKLKSLCKRLLHQVPGESLKLKKLKSLVEEHSPAVFSNFTSRRDAVAHLKQKLEGCKKFSVEGKRVRLTSRRS
ncbi:hypothetical protein OIU76_003966 [Salix suchowensis]|nr:hypothetical protein OIU76_003966 [Salix suchowensis]